METPDSSSASSPSTPQINVGIIVACLMLGMLMSSLGQMIFSTALPTLVGELGGAEHMSWVISAFMLTMTVAMPIYGKLGDQVGRKNLFIFAIALFLTGSVIGATAHSMATMILARAIQGLGGGGLMILSQAIMADVVPARQRGKYMGAMAGVFGLSSVLGPLLGGFFTDGPGWRWALWFNVPLGLITIVVALIFLKIPRHGSRLSLDVWGTATMAVSTSALILTVTWGGREHAWTSPVILGLVAVTVVVGALFVLIELRQAEPIIPMGLFRARNFTLVTASGIIMGIAMFGTLSYLPTYIQMVHNLGPTAAGLMMIPMMAGMVITSVSVGQFVTRTGKYRYFPVVGMLIMAVGLFLLGRMHAEDSLVHLGLVEAIFGMGLGMTMQTLMLIVQNTFPVRMVGTATAANNFFRQIGGAIGASVVGSMFSHRVREAMADSVPAALKQLGPDATHYAQMFASGQGKSLTPAMVHDAPAALKTALVTSYNDALVPILGAVAPLALLAALVVVFVKPERLKETVE